MVQNTLLNVKKFMYALLSCGQVRHEPLFESATWDDEWCWEEKTLEVEVGTVDRTGLVFVQKGFWMHVKSTHALSGFTLQPHKDPVPLQLQVLHVILHSDGCF